MLWVQWAGIAGSCYLVMGPWPRDAMLRRWATSGCLILRAKSVPGSRFAVVSEQSRFWSPDGTKIVYSAGNEMDTLFEKAVSGGEEKELLKKMGETLVPDSWSHNGRFLLYTALVQRTRNGLWVLSLEGDRKPVRLLGTQFSVVRIVFTRWTLDRLQVK